MKSRLAMAAALGSAAAPSALLAQDETAGTLTVEEMVTIGDDTTRAINTFLDVSQVPATTGPVYIGNTVRHADAITIDSGGNFPPGIAFRRYLETAAAPAPLTAGTQLGYLDFRAYSGSLFFNAASFDVVVDGLYPFVNGELPPTKMRFAVSNGDETYVPMELRANGRLEIGALDGGVYYKPAFSDPRFYVNSQAGHWGALFSGNSTTGANYALKTYTATANATDYLIGGASGPTGKLVFSVRGNGDTHVGDLFIRGASVSNSLTALDGRITDNVTRIDANEAQIGENTSRIADNTTRINQNTAQIGALAVSVADHDQRIGAVETAQQSASAKLTNQAYGTTATAYAVGTGAMAVGANARAGADAATAVGYNTVASGVSTTGVGAGAQATATNSTAVGVHAKALRDGAVAAGYKALATGNNGVAIGNAAVVVHDNAVVVGAGARSTAANQVTLGGAGTSVRVGDLAASTAAQVGPVDVVTVDQSGTLGRQQVATRNAVEAVRASVDYIAAITDEQFSALSERVAGVAGQIDTLFDLNETIDKDAQQGIAAIAAMSHPHFPSEPGKTSYASNVAVYRGEVGFSAGVMHRFDGDFAITAGATYAGGNSAAFRAGVAGEF